MLKRPTIPTLALILATGLACEDGSAPLVGDTLLVQLGSPATDDGALLLLIDAPAPPTVEAASSTYRAFGRVRPDGRVAAAVIGSLDDGPVLLLRFPERVDPSSVSMALQQVADRDNELRGDLSGYTLRVTKP